MQAVVAGSMRPAAMIGGPVTASSASLNRAAVIRPSRAAAVKFLTRPAITARPLRTSTAVFAQLKAPVTFSVAAKVGSGKQLRVVGAPRELGAWDYKAAPQLAADGAVFTGTVLLAVGQEAEFKFVVYNEADKGAEWESIANRTISPSGPEAYSSTWDVPDFLLEEAEGEVVIMEDTPQYKHAADAEVQGRLNAHLKKLAAEAVAKK